MSCVDRDDCAERRSCCGKCCQREAPVYARWPDGTMCEIGDVGQYTWMSDDFERVRVTEFAADGTPISWERV